jgi:hypothetical protein
MRMKIIIEENKPSNDVNKIINEMVLHVSDRSDKQVTFADEHSIVYGRLKTRLQLDIVKFCLNEVDLKDDLMFFRSMVGDTLRESDILNYVKDVQDKYNNGRSYNRNVSIDYFMETTRYDFVLVLFVTIVRGENIFQTRFVFRYRKSNINAGVYGVSMSGLPEKK